MDLDREIQLKKTEISTLSQMLDNAKKDLRKLEQRRMGEKNGAAEQK